MFRAAIPVVFYATYNPYFPNVHACCKYVQEMLIIVADDPLSISHIVVNGRANCRFFGVDGSNTAVGPFQTVDVGPPQTQVSGFCFSA